MGVRAETGVRRWNEMTRLLKTLDQLLGQLPEPAIQKFTQNDEYKLYERTLARYGI
jgi:hypothetical protein